MSLSGSEESFDDPSSPLVLDEEGGLSRMRSPRSEWTLQRLNTSLWRRVAIVLCTLSEESESPATATVTSLTIAFPRQVMFVYLEESEAAEYLFAGPPPPPPSHEAIEDAEIAEILEEVDANRIREHLREYARKPHLAGSPRDRELAEHTKTLWESYGLDSVEIVEYSVLLSYPVSAFVTLLPADTSAPRVNLSLTEDVVPESGHRENPVTFNGYSGTGNVEGALVYAGYGNRHDFERLGRDKVEGNVVLVRYGRGFRGNKCHNAELFGAVACLIYTDPADDGPVAATKHDSAVYPNGPYRPLTSVQRGSMKVCHGDTLTPGFAATADAPRIDVAKVRDESVMGSCTLPRIPIQPLHAKSARPLLEQLGGDLAPDNWQSEWLDNSLHVGPGPVRVRVAVEMSEEVTPVWNVIGRIDGTDEKEQAVILGNHRDAWTYGAVDPSSGSATLNEVVRVWGGLLDNDGFRPSRTVLFCSWDAEEYGLIGSTEFVEEHSAWLRSSAVAYLNVDEAAPGNKMLSVRGTPQFATVVRETSGAILLDERNRQSQTLLANWRSQFSSADTVRVVPAGSGSDHAPFLQLLGVPVLDLAFIDPDYDNYPVYHSNYDSFYWIDKFGDPGFSRHAALARLWATVSLRLADDRLLPLNYTEYADALVDYSNVLREAYEKEVGSDGVDSTFGPLRAAIASLRTESLRVDDLRSAISTMNDTTVRVMNRALLSTERAFISSDGVSGPDQYAHVIFRPSTDDIYSSTQFPNIMHAIRLKDSSLIAKAVSEAVMVVSNAAHLLADALNLVLEE